MVAQISGQADRDRKAEQEKAAQNERYRQLQRKRLEALQGFSWGNISPDRFAFELSSLSGRDLNSPANIVAKVTESPARGKPFNDLRSALMGRTLLIGAPVEKVNSAQLFARRIFYFDTSNTAYSGDGVFKNFEVQGNRFCIYFRFAGSNQIQGNCYLAYSDESGQAYLVHPQEKTVWYVWGLYEGDAVSMRLHATRAQVEQGLRIQRAAGLLSSVAQSAIKNAFCGKTDRSGECIEWDSGYYILSGILGDAITN